MTVNEDTARYISAPCQRRSRPLTSIAGDRAETLRTAVVVTPRGEPSSPMVVTIATLSGTTP